MAQNVLNLERNYINIIQKFKSRQNDILELEINRQYENYLINLNLLLTEFSFESEELIDALLLTKQNILHPVILNNNQLKMILDEIELSLLHTQILPINMKSDSASEDFLKLIKNETIFSENQMIFIIIFPICDFEDYNMYHI